MSDDYATGKTGGGYVRGDSGKQSADFVSIPPGDVTKPGRERRHPYPLTPDDMGTGKICYRCGAPEGSPNPRPEHPCDRGHAFPKDEPAISPLARAAVGELLKTGDDGDGGFVQQQSILRANLLATLSRVEATTEARVRAEVCQTTWMKAMACFPAASFCGGDWENAWNGALQEVEIRMRAAIAKDGIEIVGATLTSPSEAK